MLRNLTNEMLAEVAKSVTAEISQRLTSESSEIAASQAIAVAPMQEDPPPYIPPEPGLTRFEGLDVSLTDDQILRLSKSAEFQGLLLQASVTAAGAPSGQSRRELIHMRQGLRAAWQQSVQAVRPFRPVGTAHAQSPPTERTRRVPPTAEPSSRANTREDWDDNWSTTPGRLSGT
jgi:hypothetical protein